MSARSQSPAKYYASLSERGRDRDCRGSRVSPGLRSRPSLSERSRGYLGGQSHPGRVSPGLRSRPSLSAVGTEQLPERTRLVSPGLRSRPSLSDPKQAQRAEGRASVSPGLRSRPSLSGCPGRDGASQPGSVAGTTVPAFVERSTSTTTTAPARTSVAGTTVPVFVERCLRSSGSVSCPRVAGTTVPAFVER